MSIDSFDHVAIPTARPEQMLRFYRALGFSAPTPEAWHASKARHFAIHFGANKINMHAPELWQDASFTLRGSGARPGCGDFCFVWSGGLQALKQLLERAGAPIEAGPDGRVGARGRGTSLYTRDPDGNLLEFIMYEPVA